MTGWDGLGSAPQKLDLNRCPISFSQLTNASQLQRPGSPISTSRSMERKRFGGSLGEGLEYIGR